MPLDPLYSDSTATFLAGQNQVTIPDPGTPAPSTGIGSIVRASGRGIGQGAASLFGAASDTTAGLSQLYVDPDSAAGAALNPASQAINDKQINDALAKAKAGTLFQSSTGTAAYNLADTLKPDPTNTTAVDRVVQGAFSGLTQIVPATLLGGPLAGAAVGGTSIGMAGAEDLKRQGVDVGTRTAIGTLEGVAGGAGAVLPVGGSTIAQTAGLVALGGPGLTIAQSAAEKAILKNANYDHLADQIDPLDPVNLAASTLVAGTFGALHTVGAARAAGKADATKTAAPAAAANDSGVPITSMSVDARKALKYNAPQLDAYATQTAQAAGVPPEMLLFIKNGGEKSNSNQVSSAGAMGVMQFTPDTWKIYGKGDPTDPVNSINAGVAYSADLLKRYNGDMRAALTEYNGGVKQAQAVHAGGAATDPETIAYLQRYDAFAANHQITNMKFDPTPQQVDASLVSHSQGLVDDAHIGPADDVAAMSAHQDAFELAARQMDAGQPVDVTGVMPPEFTRGDVLGDYARQIGKSGSSDFFDGTHLTDENGAPLRVFHGSEKPFEPEGNLWFARDPNVANDYATDLASGKHESGANVTPAYLKMKNPLSIDAEGANYYEIPFEGGRFNSDALSLEAQHRGHDGLIIKNVKDGSVKPTDVFKIFGKDGMRSTFESVDEKPGASSSGGKQEVAPSPIEQNVRQAAIEQPDTVAHLDANAGPVEGKISDLLQTIDDEHQATLQDASLLQVAANCFISSGD